MRIFTLVTLAAMMAACGGSSKPAEAPKSDNASSDTKADTTAAAADAGAASTDTAKADETAAKPADATAEKTEDKKAAPAGDCSKDMYKKYGDEGFSKVNDAIIAKAVAAPVDKVGPTFKKLAKNKKEAARVKTNLLAFLVKVYGGPDNYKGKDMVTVHKGMKITSDQYDWFVGNVVVPSLKENGVSDDDIKNCFAPPVTDAAFKSTIVTAK